MNTDELKKDNLTIDQKRELLKQLVQKSAIKTGEIANCNSKDKYEPFPLTSIQKAYIIGRSATNDGIACHTYEEYESINLDIDKLENAFLKVIKRHDMLRAKLLRSGEQVVRSMESITLELHRFSIKRIDLRLLDDDSTKQKLEHIRSEMSNQKLSIESDFPVDIRVSLLANNRYIVHLDFDMTFFDAASCLCIIEDWADYYQNPNKTLEELHLTFRDAVIAENLFHKSHLVKKSLDYWSERIKTLPKGPELPVVDSNIIGKTKKHHIRKKYTIDTFNWLILKNISQDIGITPSVLLCTAYADAIGTYALNTNFTLNLTLFNRRPIHHQIKQVVGEFTSTLLLEVNREDANFADRAKKLQEQMLQDLDHLFVSGVDILREMNRGLGSESIILPIVFTSLLGHKSSVLNSTSLEQWIGKQVFSISQTPHVWIDHLVYDDGDNIILTWDVCEGIFPEGLVDSMFSTYIDIIEGLINGSILQKTYRRLVSKKDLEIINNSNQTKTHVSNKLLHELFEDMAYKNPKAIAVINDKKEFTYEKIQKISYSLASRILNLGLKKSSLIATYLDKGCLQISSALSIMMSGNCYLPIDIRLPTERVNDILDLGKVELIITTSEASISKLLKTSQYTRKVIYIDDILKEIELKMVELRSFASPIKPLELGKLNISIDDLAYVIFTSGSTGTPKGVMIDHKGAVNTIIDINSRFSINQDDKIFSISALGFDLSIYDIFGILAVGATIIIPSSDKDPLCWLKDIKKHKVSVWNSVPALMEMLIVDAKNDDLHSLKTVLLSGDWIPLEHPNKIKKLAPNATVVSLGGATEASIWSILYPIKEVNEAWTSIPYGYPMANQSFAILDEHKELCPIWVTGDLYIDGIGVALGYFEDEKRTNESFSKNQNQEKRYKTGDKGRYKDNGEIEFLGRVDQQVKIQGHRIELGEIEKVLSSHKDVLSAIVMAHGESKKAKKLVGYILEKTNKNSEAGAFDISSNKIVTWEELKNTSPLSLARMPDNFLEYSREIDNASIVYSALALNNLGAFEQDNKIFSVDDILHITGILIRYKPWLIRTLDTLVSYGLLSEEKTYFKRIANWPKDASLSEGIQKSDHFIGAIAFVKRAASQLSSALVGETHAVDFLFPKGESKTAVGLYEDWFNPCNNFVSQLVEKIVEEDSKFPESNLRVLEIGAGIGSTTRHILEKFDNKKTEYHYSDISNYFLEYARKSFSDYTFLTFGILDIEKDPSLQGYDLHSYDLIIAASVLHATQSISDTLKNIKALLRKNGILIMIEETKFHPAFNLTMGLQQGFDRFTDTHLRKTNPLLTSQEWASELKKEAFEDIITFDLPNTISDSMGFKVMIALNQGKRGVDTLELKQFLSKKLPDYMIPKQIVLIDEIPLTSNGKVDRKALCNPYESEVEKYINYIAPTNIIEEKIANIWSTILTKPKVGIDDNFFDLGGDSLLLVKIRAELALEFEAEIPMVELFQHTTVRSIARKISNEITIDKSKAYKSNYDNAVIFPSIYEENIPNVKTKESINILNSDSFENTPDNNIDSDIYNNIDKKNALKALSQRNRRHSFDSNNHDSLNIKAYNHSDEGYHDE